MQVLEHYYREYFIRFTKWNQMKNRSLFLPQFLEVLPDSSYEFQSFGIGIRGRKCRCKDVDASDSF